MELSLMKMSKVFDLMREVAALEEAEMQLLAFELHNFYPNKADSLQFAIESAFYNNVEEVA
jgi:hypothetical protein